MFGDESKLLDPLHRSMKITIVNSQATTNSPDLSKRIIEKAEIEFKNRLKFSILSNIKDIYKDITPLTPEQQNKKGLLNTKWLEEICIIKPSVIIYYYHVKEGVDKDKEEQKIFNQIEEIKKYDNIVTIFLFIISKDSADSDFNDPTSNIYIFASEYTNKSYNLRRILNKEFIFVFPDEEIWKYFEFPQFCSNILYYARQYYAKLKNKLKEKRVKLNSNEEKIECDIQLGILSTIKTRKIDVISKYFERAYSLLCDKNFDKKNYIYGTKPPKIKLNYSEIRAVADWLFFKTFKLSKKSYNTSNNTNFINRHSSIMTKIDGSDIEHSIDDFMNHIKKFSKGEYADDINDPLTFVSFYWLFQRYKQLSNYCVENYKALTTSKNKLLLLGIVHFEKIYNLIRMINYYRKYLINKNDLITVKHKNKDVSITQFEIVTSIIYGKPPTFIYKDAKNPLIKEELPFNEEIYIKKFLYENKFNLDNMIKNLKDVYIPETITFYQKLDIKNINITQIQEINNNIWGIKFYLNILKNLVYSENVKEIYKLDDVNNVLVQIYDIMQKYDYIKKFPKIHLNYLNKYTDALIYQMNYNSNNFTLEKKSQLYINLSLLANMRKLNETEENIFINLLNDSELNTNNTTIKLEYNNFKNENTFNFDYTVKDIDKSKERKILDLVEYEFTFSSLIPNEEIKFNSMKIYFTCINEKTTIINGIIIPYKQKEIIFREYEKEELNNYPMKGNDLPAVIRHKLFMKQNKGEAFVSKIVFTLCKKENFTYEILVPKDLKKMIFVEKTNKNIINIDFKNNSFIAGVNEYKKFEFDIQKEHIEKIKIEEFKMKFESKPSFYIKEIKSILKSQIPQMPINLYNNTINNSNLIPKMQFDNKLLNQNMATNLPNFNSQMFNNQLLTNQLYTNNMNNNLLLQNKNLMQNVSLRNSSFSYNMNMNMMSSFLDPKSSLKQKDLKINAKIQPIPETIAPIQQITQIKEELPKPEFFIISNNKLVKSDNGIIEESFPEMEKLLLDGKNKFGILIKFLHEGNYNIKFNISYVLKHIETNDIFELDQDFYLNYKVIEPFSFYNEINSGNFVSLIKNELGNSKRETVYLTDKNIKFNLILTNKLEENVNINKINIELDKENLLNENKNIKINSDLFEMMELIPELEDEIRKNLFTILPTADYNIPLEVKFYNEFKGSLGKIKIKWSTSSLEEYAKQLENNEILINENIFDFPFININKLELSYFYEANVIQGKNGKEVELKIKVKNNTDVCKKIFFLIEMGEEINFMLSGQGKQMTNLRQSGEFSKKYRLIPLKNGELKLPSIKIWEINSLNQAKILSNYYFPDQIVVI